MMKTLSATTALIISALALPASFALAGADGCADGIAKPAVAKAGEYTEGAQMASGDSCTAATEAKLVKAGECTEGKAMAANEMAAGDCCAAMGAKATLAKRDTAAKAFERLRTLAGNWSGTVAEAEGAQESEASEDMVNYRVTGGGSAVVETLFIGSPHEMVSVYFMQGDELVMTHYCAAGNQPHLRLVSAEDNKFVFERSGGTNIVDGQGAYIDGLILTMDGDNIRHEWSGKMNGEPMPTTVVDLHRSTAASTASL